MVTMLTTAKSPYPSAPSRLYRMGVTRSDSAPSQTCWATLKDALRARRLRSDVTGRRDEEIPRRARVSDLVVFGAQPDDSPELGGAIETTLVASGRPLLLAPKAVQAIGSTSTPTTFVNGRALVGAQPLTSFQRLIDEAKAKAKASTTATSAGGR